MKKTILSVVASMVLVALMSVGAFAQTVFPTKGSALVPVTVFWGHATNYTQTAFSLSNISGSTVQCRVTLYDHDGAEVSSIGKIYSGGSGTTSVLVSSSTNEFTLPPHASRRFVISLSGVVSGIVGHAVIEWTSDDTKLHKAIIGEVWRTGMAGSGTYYAGNYLINNGQPF